MATATRLSATLSFYIGRRFLFSFAVVLFVMAAVILLIDVVELFRRTTTKPNVSLQLVLQMAFFKLPFMIQKVVPFALLFGGMHTFWRLTRFHELAVVRAAGVSVWQFLFPAILIALLIGIFNIMVFNPVASTMLSRHEQLESKFLLGRTSLLSVSKSGLWLRQADDKGQSVIHASHVTSPDMRLRNVIIFLYEGTDRFIGRLDASEARLENGYWDLKDVVLTAPGRPAEIKARHRVKTNWTLDKIQDSFAAPETMSFWDLPAFIDLLDSSGFSATRHRLYWHSLLAIPLLLCAMVLIAAVFSLRLARRGAVAVLIGCGVMFGFLLFVLSDMVMALGISANLPPALAAWSPAGVTLLLGLAVLLHIEDG